MNARDKKKKLTLGLLMMAAFLVVLVAMFMPIFGGHNGLNYMDSLYNSISKGSAAYIPEVALGAEQFKGQEVTLTLKMEGELQARRAAALLAAAGAQASAAGETVTARGGLGKMLVSSLADAEAMFHNQGEKVDARYSDMDARTALYTWWLVNRAMQKDLNRQSKFKAAAYVEKVRTKAIECAYNYYKIEPQSITDRMGIVIFSLIFYVVYTVWYGYAVMYLFEGFGFDLAH